MLYLIEETGVQLYTYGTPSHTETNLKKNARAPSWMMAWPVAGNKETDNLADTAAELHKLPPSVTYAITENLQI